MATSDIKKGPLYVDSTNNRVGIGTSSPDNPLHVVGDSTIEHRTNVEFKIQDAADAGGGTRLSSYWKASGSDVEIGNVEIDLTNGTTGSENSQILFKTIGSGTLAERMRILSSGGITFNGDTAAANALDDYEEGTWTANINFGSNTGSSTGATYGESTGNYVKIGNLVHVQCRIALNNKGSSTGNANITGLPFSSNGGGVPIIPFACWYTSFTGVTRGQVVIGRIDNNSSGIELRFLDGNNEAVLNNTHLANNSNVAISGTYYTTS